LLRKPDLLYLEKRRVVRAAREDLLLRGARYRSASARQKSEFVVPMGSDEPLLGRRYQAALPEKAAADGDGDASFVQTCLNGLNALSGVVPVLCLLQYCFLIGTMPLIDLLDIRRADHQGLGCSRCPTRSRKGAG